MSQCLYRFQEHGITQYWFMQVYRDQSWLNKFFDDHPKENSEPEALRFSSIIGALLVLFVSHILSFIVFICELSATKQCVCRFSKRDDGYERKVKAQNKRHEKHLPRALDPYLNIGNQEVLFNFHITWSKLHRSNE